MCCFKTVCVVSVGKSTKEIYLGRACIWIGWFWGPSLIYLVGLNCWLVVLCCEPLEVQRVFCLRLNFSSFLVCVCQCWRTIKFAIEMLVLMFYLVSGKWSIAEWKVPDVENKTHCFPFSCWFLYRNVEHVTWKCILSMRLRLLLYSNVSREELAVW